MSAIQQRINEHAITIPEASPLPAALYVPYTISGNQVLISGQLPFQDGELVHTGLVGKDISLEEGQATARACAVNVVSQLKAACGGDLDKVKRILKLEILVAAPADFDQPHVVANGASQLIKDVFGEEKGAHARVAYGVSVLPMNASVEVAATVELA